MEIDRASRVLRGAALLDAKCPGWELEINPDTLDLSDPRLCVLGQVFDSYVQGRDALGLDVGEAEVTHGFMLEDGIWRTRMRAVESGTDPDRRNSLAYAPLTDVWKALLGVLACR